MSSLLQSTCSSPYVLVHIVGPLAATVQSKTSGSVKVSKEIVPFQEAQVRIPNLVVRCKKMIQLDFRSRSQIKNPTPSLNVL